MATTKFYLDKRAVREGKPAPLKLAITKKGKTALLNLNVMLLPEQWDRIWGKIVNHPNKLFLNMFITRRKLDVDTEILRLIEKGLTCKMSAKDIKDLINERIVMKKEEENGLSEDGLFAARFRYFAGGNGESTKGIYMHTYRRMLAFDKDLEERTFEDINKDWLTAFEMFLAQTAPSKNARNVHLRNIRAVFNDAIDDEVTTCYPFRKFKIRPVATPKRSLSVEQLRELFAWPVEDYAVKYLDMFKLTFWGL